MTTARSQLVDAIIEKYNKTRPSGQSNADWVLSSPKVRYMLDALTSERLTMSDDEILQRARQACANVAKKFSFMPQPDQYLAGECDKGATMLSVIAALRGIDKPVGDPLVLKARQVVYQVHKERYGDGDGGEGLAQGLYDTEQPMLVAIAALKAAGYSA